jgi:hypothetical protein
MRIEAPLDRDARQPGREIVQLQGQGIAPGKVRDIPLLNMPLEELAFFELGALPGRQVVDVEGGDVMEAYN